MTGQPWVISSVDPAVAGYLNGLAAVDVFSATQGKEWGFAIDVFSGQLAGGTAYIVSDAAYRRIITGRYGS